MIVVPDREVKLNQRAWIGVEAFFLREAVDEKGEKKFLLDMNLIPFGKVSRNGILYNKEATLACLPTLVGRPLLDNHSDETPLREAPPLGHFIKAWYDETEDMAKGTADLDPAEVTIIHKIKRKDITHCSIQVLANRAVDREVNGVAFAEAYPDEFLEASLVKIEGFKQATLTNLIAEAFKVKEDITQQPSWQGDLKQRKSGVQTIGGTAEGTKCPNCQSDKVGAAPNVEKGYTCFNCGNQFMLKPQETEEKKEDVTTGNAGGMTTTTMPNEKPFELKHFLAMVNEGKEAEAREYAEEYLEN